MTAIVLHLSDIHIKTAKDPILKRGASIAAARRRHQSGPFLRDAAKDPREVY